MLKIFLVFLFVVILPQLGSARPFVPKKSINDYVLSDSGGRVSKDFHISPLFKKRVEFWFDVYTKHPSTSHVIHHTRYPWVVYKVVDTSHIFMGNESYWTKYHRAQRVLRNEKMRIKRALQRLASKKSYHNLHGLEKHLYNKLQTVRGRKRGVFYFASKNVRAQMGQKDFFIGGLINSTKYLHFMEIEFKNQGLPIELTRIPFVESSFNEKAYSRVGASGIWQIMPRVGKKRLLINRTIDERNSPLKATRFAAFLLKQNYQILKKWPLAVTAYNHGTGGMKTAMKNARSQELEKVISRYHRGSFKFASANFYASFLAALYSEKYAREIFGPLVFERADPIDFAEYRLHKAMKVNQFLHIAGIAKSTFKSLNLDLNKAIRKNKILRYGLKVYIPPESKLRLENIYIHYNVKKSKISRVKYN